MENKKIILLAILFAIMVSPVEYFTIDFTDDVIGSFVLADMEYQDTAPISISSLDDFAIWNSTGDGTEGNPFVIENRSIDLKLYTEIQAAIKVTNIDSYFVIRNCLFNGWTQGIDTRGYGVWFEDVVNGKVENNIFNSTKRGISIYNTYNTTFESNTFLGDAIRETDYSTFGIYLDNSKNISILGNNVTHCSSGVWSFNTTLYHVSYNNASYNSQGATLFRWTNATLVNNNICNYNSYGGIYLVDSHFSSVINNTCSYNVYYGIHLDSLSTYNTVENNTMEGNGVDFQQESILAEFLLAGNFGYGLWCQSGSTNNTIRNNVFIDNLQSGVDEVPGNTYDYNYWSDYVGYDVDGDGIGDTPYEIAGAGGAKDYHPRGPMQTVLTTTDESTTTDGNITIDGDGSLIVLIVIGSIFLAIFVVVFLAKRRMH